MLRTCSKRKLKSLETSKVWKRTGLKMNWRSSILNWLRDITRTCLKQATSLSSRRCRRHMIDFRLDRMGTPILRKIYMICTLGRISETDTTKMKNKNGMSLTKRGKPIRGRVRRNCERNSSSGRSQSSALTMLSSTRSSSRTDTTRWIRGMTLIRVRTFLIPMLVRGPKMGLLTLSKMTMGKRCTEMAWKISQ